jgi:CheY-like chemotaxis protein
LRDRDRAAHAIETIERNAAALARIIDDLLDVSRIVAGTLRLVHYPVDLAATAQAALDDVRPLAAAKNIQLKFSPDPSSAEVVSGDASRLQQDALVSDIGLPDEDGYALVRRLREREAKRGGFLPAVAPTGYVRAEDRARVLGAGFQVHVPKPVDPAELTAAIAAVTRDPRGRESPPRGGGDTGR